MDNAEAKQVITSMSPVQFDAVGLLIAPDDGSAAYAVNPSDQRLVLQGILTTQQTQALVTYALDPVGVANA